MSELLLFRHGKSDWGAGREDTRRPLSRRGEQAARRMGRLMASAGCLPDVVLSSPAERARLTARLAAEAGGWPSPLIEDERLCPGSPDEILAVVRARGSGLERVMVVGHEPGLSRTASLLLGGASLRLPTAAVVCLAVEGWDHLTPGAATLLWMVVPRLFPNREAASP